MNQILVLFTIITILLGVNTSNENQTTTTPKIVNVSNSNLDDAVNLVR